MKIIKFKKVSGSNYNVYLEEGIIKLNERTILDKELLIKKEIEDIEEILEYNKKYTILETSLKYLKSMRSIKEMKEYLIKKEYEINSINETIDYLINLKYLNDDLYKKAFIHDKTLLTLDGPIKIKNDLFEKGINCNIEEIEIDCIDRINKYIKNKIKLNKKSNSMFKYNISNNLYNLGYYKEDIDYCLSKINIDETEIREKEYNKLKNKLSKKYKDEELEQEIKKKMYQKGFYI